jgi:hypothetical protein
MRSNNWKNNILPTLPPGEGQGEGNPDFIPSPIKRGNPIIGRTQLILILLASLVFAQIATAGESRRRRVEKPTRDTSTSRNDTENEENDDVLETCIGGCISGFVEGMVSGCIAGIFGGEVDDDGTVILYNTDRPGTDDQSTAVTPMAHQFGITVALPGKDASGQTSPQSATTTAYPAATTGASDNGPRRRLTREELLARFEQDYYNRGADDSSHQTAGRQETGTNVREFGPRKVGRSSFGINIGSGGFFTEDMRSDYEDRYTLQTFGFGAYAEIVPLRQMITGLSLYWEKNAWSTPQYNYEYDLYYTDSLGATRRRIVSEQPLRVTFYSTALTYDIGFLLEDVIYLGGSAGLAILEEKAEIREQVIDNGTVVGDRETTAETKLELFVWGITAGLKELIINENFSLELLCRARFVEGLPQQRKHPLALDYINRLASYTFLLGVGFTP